MGHPPPQKAGFAGRLGMAAEVTAGLTSLMDPAQADGQDGDKQEKEPSQPQAPKDQQFYRAEKGTRESLSFTGFPILWLNVSFTVFFFLSPPLSIL